MRWWVALLGLGLGFSAPAETALELEAKQLTAQLGIHDKYARVLTREQWQSQQDQTDVLTSQITDRVGRRTGYIKLKNFYPTGLCRDFRNELIKFKSAKVGSLILDLRDNPGGQRMIAVCIAGLLLGPKPIVGVRDIPSLIPNLQNWVEDTILVPQSEMQWLAAVTNQETEMPMALLINSASASASEIVAAALRDYQRAWIVGRLTFGKGMAQEYSPMKDRPELIVGYTIQQFYSPLGISPERNGIIGTVAPDKVSTCAAVNGWISAPDVDRAYAEALLDCGS